MKSGVMVVLAAVFAAGIATASSIPEAELETERSRLSCIPCDWGLLTVEESLERPHRFIEITSPADYSGVDGTAFTLSGIAANLSSNRVHVEVSDGDGETLFEGSATVLLSGAGRAGTWSLYVDLGEVSRSTRVFVSASSASPDGGPDEALDSLRMLANSSSGVRFVEIHEPHFGEGVSPYPLAVTGRGGGAFENTIVIEARNLDTREVLARTAATIQSRHAGGAGPFEAELDLEAEPGTPIEIHAFQPPIADDEEVTVSAYAFAVASPFAQSYERYLQVRRDDPLYGAQSACAAALAEFENQAIAPLLINDVTIISTRSMRPLVHVSIMAAGSSVCAAPLRVRTTRAGNEFDIEVYRDVSSPLPCTSDLAPIPLRVSLGTLDSPEFTVRVNGVEYQ